MPSCDHKIDGVREARELKKYTGNVELCNIDLSFQNEPLLQFSVFYRLNTSLINGKKSSSD